MSFTSRFTFFAAVLLGVSLSSCIATKSYQKPDVATENLYPFEQVTLDSTTLADMPWQDVFRDPRLRQLIDEALDNNLELQQAIQQIRVAEANFYEGRMSLFPSLSANGDVSYREQSDNSVSFGGLPDDASIPASELYSVSLSSSWELDVWGKLTSAKKASLAALLQTEATRRAVQTTLIANVANAYYRLLALDQQLAITRQTVENRRQDVETVRSLKEGDMVTGVSLQQSIANRYAAEVTIPRLEQLITEQEHTLSILLGRAPGSIKRGTLPEQAPIDSLTTGMPAQLLRNRPDIRAAEYAFRSAFELTNNARAYFYPSFTLTAQGGYQSLETEDLFQPGSVFYNLVAGLTQPIFNRGQNRARLKRRKAQQEQALLQLKGTILDASSEVSNALSQYQKTDRQLQLRQKQLEALENAVAYSRELLQYGEANYTEVLTAQQQLLSAQLSNINDRLQQLTAGVDLYRALGGGWNKTQKATAVEQPAETQD
ncbi:efflux transporter outer membrane subunit [Fodinibius sediminis]|uniref:Efflux transporter, outer membrane factor (OMF) lipoprotein, NodT family n=1 Tax=Fodinibius sediminis TaxID=1214077 RepID=A0A521ARR2_9BACT|nr:efflux transporter outer membrane subunit [Fodinibius sediminis]SMO37479.1 efflux transporter, outer membrane factor (OMF) lipoprotein, NodT family [Fodinibius sediminis]